MNPLIKDKDIINRYLQMYVNLCPGIRTAYAKTKKYMYSYMFLLKIVKYAVVLIFNIYLKNIHHFYGYKN